MSEVRLLQAGRDDQVAWDDFVSADPASSYCHLSGWKRIVESVYGKSCFYLQMTQGDRWLGVAPFVHMPGILGRNRLVSLPFLDQGGVLGEDRKAAEELFRAALQIVRDIGATGLDLRGGSPTETQGLRPETQRFRFVLRLGSSDKELWGSIGSKVRNHIRKSRKQGIETSAVGIESLDLFYSVFARNMRDLGSPAHAFAFFQAIFLEFGDLARLYVTRDRSGEPVAGGVAIRFRETVSIPWASSLRSARLARPNYSLYWKMLEDARVEGARLFDFGRSSEGTGTFAFKKQWGAAATPLVWNSYDRAGENQQEQVMTPQSKPLLPRMWSRLPLPVANRLGPRIRGRLAN